MLRRILIGIAAGFIGLGLSRLGELHGLMELLLVVGFIGLAEGINNTTVKD